MFSFTRWLAIVEKELIQIRRDPISMRIPFLMPIVMMLLFGYAVNTGVDKIKTAVFDMSKSANSREYIQKFMISDYFILERYVNSESELEALIDTGVVKAGLMIPPDYAEHITSGQMAATRLVIDGTDPTTARTALNSGLMVNQIYSSHLQDDRIKKAGGTSKGLPAIVLHAKVWYNPDLKSSRFTIPGLVGLILQNITIMLTAFALVREKERGTIEQLMVTPMKPLELILGKLAPYTVIGYVAFLFALGICVFWFGVPILGSVPLLLFLGFLFVLCSLSIGMMISTIAKNQLQALMALIIILLPSVLLSGFIFPREAMPWMIHAIGYLIPLTYFLDIVRGIVLKGIGLEFLNFQVYALLVFLCMILLTATVRFRKNLG